MKNNKVHLRFAPSPTGKLHIGGARVAVLNDLMVKKLGGKLTLRIEDTDTERSQNEYTQQIQSSLESIGVKFDECIHQSDRHDRYREFCYTMLSLGHAFFCNAESDSSNSSSPFRSPFRDKKISPSDIKDNINEYAIRMKMPKDKIISINDEISGIININTNEIDDFVILRKNNLSTYNLSCAYDDYIEGVTHIIRGNDHIINTAKQLLIHEAFNTITPKIYHLPLMHSADGEKFSKRKGNAITIEELLSKNITGYAIWLYLAGIGWASDNIFSHQNIIENFNINHISSSPSQFDYDKLVNINNKTFGLDNNHLEFIKNNENRNICLDIFDILNQKTSTQAIIECFNYINNDNKSNIAKDIILNFSIDNNIQLNVIKNIIYNIKNDSQEIFNGINTNIFNKNYIKNFIKDVSIKENVKSIVIYSIFRIVLLGKIEMPGILDILEKIDIQYIIRSFNDLYNQL